MSDRNKHKKVVQIYSGETEKEQMNCAIKILNLRIIVAFYWNIQAIQTDDTQIHNTDTNRWTDSTKIANNVVSICSRDVVHTYLLYCTRTHTNTHKIYYLWWEKLHVMKIFAEYSINFTQIFVLFCFIYERVHLLFHLDSHRFLITLETVNIGTSF